MKVLFFASLRERLQCDQEEWADTTDITSPQDIINRLVKRGEPWESALQSGKVLVSINQEMAQLNSHVKAGDEIAFFPPVTGG
ncbi:MoaD/ThiS family protein [Alkalimarinus sediminis]|uniref:Molybdopterin synthase sulfur carrier subunit n=1 Tax=Alkalimarinus sediminis TaxID=1632866 RepID=A0A9E8KQH3_9ALTE|nr:MoaD/ThiS family protein [Alkalimarinus sediminis]UZW74722.1 MoaD/ThiS family protein [Alkalimarinus sediminis]